MTQLEITDSQYLALVLTVLTQISWSDHLLMLAKAKNEP